MIFWVVIMNQREFGLYFAKLREKSGFKSQRQLSEVSGVSNGSIARIEAGTQQPTPPTLKKLALHLKEITYEELLSASGYLDGQNDQNKIIKSDQTYDSLSEINMMIKEFGIEDIGFFDIEKWKNLSPDDVEEIRRHFEWVAQKAKERNEEKD